MNGHLSFNGSLDHKFNSSFLYDNSFFSLVLYYRKKTIMMATPKLEAFIIAEQELAAFAKALAHPARIAILKVLAQKNECICGEIVDMLPLAQSTVSQHLKELKEAGLINCIVDGPRSCYCINWKAFEQFNESFNHLFKNLKVQQQNTCC